MNLTFSGTLEEFDAFVLRYRLTSKSVTLESPASPTKPGMIQTQTAVEKKTDSDIVQKQESDFFIPKFEWDRKEEKLYKTLFFYEHEDGRVVLSYFSSKVFTTKEKVLTIPYPLITDYEPLRSMFPNKRSALRFYRQYLAESGSSSKYIEKSTQDRIKENVLQKEKTMETIKEMKPRTKELREMTIKMGIQ